MPKVISVPSIEGVTLKTKNKYVKDNIAIQIDIPKLTPETVSVTDVNPVEIPTKDKYLTDNIKVSVDIPHYGGEVTGNEEAPEIEILNIESPDDMNTLLTYENIGKVYRYVGETTEDYVNGALYEVAEEV